MPVLRLGMTGGAEYPLRSSAAALATSHMASKQSVNSADLTQTDVPYQSSRPRAAFRRLGPSMRATTPASSSATRPARRSATSTSRTSPVGARRPSCSRRRLRPLLKDASATACASDAALSDIWVNRSWRQIVGAGTIACSSCTGQGAFRQRVFASVEGLPGRRTALWRSKQPVRENALGVVQRSLGQALGRRSSPAHRCHGDSGTSYADLLRQTRARIR